MPSLRDRTPLALAAALALVPASAAAVDDASGRLSLHGDGQWSYQRTSGDNALLEGTPEGNYDTAMFDLVVTARPSEDLVISAQLGFDPREVGAEWVFAEWRLSEKLRFKVGKIHQPIGNFNELRFAGTTRAFYDLPVSVYGPGNVIGTSVLGLAVTGQAELPDGWSLVWDGYAGAVRLTEVETYRGLPLAAGSAGTTVAPEERQVREVLGGRVSLTTPGELTFRLSGYGGKSAKEAEESRGFFAGGASVQYRGEQLWLSAEGFGSREVGSETAWAGYLSASWFLTEQLQAAARFDAQRTGLQGLSTGSPLLRHTEWAVGLNWWFTPAMVLKASFHDVTGNRFAFPEEAFDTELADAATAPSDRTQLVVVGAQFAF